MGTYDEIWKQKEWEMRIIEKMDKIPGFISIREGLEYFDSLIERIEHEEIGVDKNVL